MRSGGDGVTVRECGCRIRLFAVLLLLVAGCASQGQRIRLSDDQRLNAFLETVRDNVQAHAWDAVVALADPGHYETQVLELDISEPQYVAELLGLHNVDNNIGAGEAIEWAHLERIETLHIETLETSGTREWTARGHVELNDGSRLRASAVITMRDGDYRLSGGVG